jgi:Carboxypeptidase regulatory-like domain/TonB-dependent Receptor Plug Domain
MRSTARVFLTALFCLAMDAVAPEPAFAQGGGATTSLSGTVTDTSGAIIPGATVVVKNVGTATQFDAVTNESGYFSVPALDPGAYSVTVTLMGFKTAVLNDVRVNASTPATVKVALAVGGLEETVVVTGGAEIIQTTSAAVTSTIDTNQILKIPTGSRSALEFVALLPGVSTPGGPGGSRDSTVNGLPQSAINITIDGMSAQDNHLKTGDGFFARVSPRLDAIEEVTVNSAAQDASSTGQGAVQIRFVTRSGSNQFTGSSYYYLQHNKLNANTWFNNRDNAPKSDDVLHQPGARLGGPVIIPGLWNGRNKAFFFVNYEESRSPGGNTENRTLLHPRAEQGWFRYTAGGETREVNVLALAAANGHVSTIDPTIGRLLGDIRSSTSGSTVVDNTDPLTQNLTYSYNTDSVTKYPTGRLDVNLTDKHRLSWSMTYTDLVSTPDTTNNREPNFPGFPNTGSQVSDRYITRGTLRSTLGANLVNEFTVGGSGGPTKFSPEIAASQFSGTSVADQAGFLLNINTVGGITNAASTGAYSAREASTKVVENTLSWLRGTHSIQAGGSWTRTDIWLQNQQYVPTMNFGVDTSGDPANAMFTTANFAGASAAQLTEARDLFATLTGRVTSINGEQRLDENTDEYVFLGLGMQRARLVDYGFFVADTWRWKPSFTLNLGLRYDLQLPFYPRNNSYSKATVADVWGRSGVGNLFRPGGLTGQSPSFSQYDEGEGAYDTDMNNWAPNVGFAWTLGGNGGFLKTLLGREHGDSVLRAGYSMGYNRPGTSDFTGAIAANPGVSLTANRSAALANLGAPGTIFLRNRADVGPPPNMPVTRVYPMSDVITGDITVFEPGLQVPYAMTWTGGWQRKVGSNMVVEARYVGSRSLQSWQTYNYNEINIVENGFLNEFRAAQKNLESNIAAGRGNTFAYTGAPGTAALPIFLAYFNALPASASGNTGSYTGANWTNTTFLGFLAKFNPQPYNFANTGTDRLIGNATLRNNALTAGLPANFFQANPDLIGGANIVGNGGATYYNSLQLEMRKRLAQGLQFQSSYVYAKQDGTQRFSLRYPRERIQDTGTEGGVVHAFRANWVYELPFGQGRRFASGVGPWMNRLIGGWSLDGIARMQSGTTLDFGNVRLMGMSTKELQDAFKLRFDDAGKLLYMLPQDIIDNTVRAFNVSATSATGYGDQGVPQGRYMAPANGPDCIEVAQSNTITGIGDCGVRSLVVTGPTLVRFDLSTSKRIAIKGNTNVEFRAEFLNAFNTPWFEAVTGSGTTNTYTNPSLFRVTDADSGRTIQFVFRVNF